MGRPVTCTAYGYDLKVGGRRERRFSETWTKDDARAALVERQREIAAGTISRPEHRTLGQLRDEYLAYKLGKKRSLDEDERILATRLLPAFGLTLPVRQLTAPMIAHYEKRRSGQVSAFTVANELAVLRHMLNLGRKWGYLVAVPDIELPKKPDGRLRYLEPDEIGRLLTACASSRNPYLSAIVSLALNTGMRKEEILGLAWERIDVAADYGLSARLTLYRTKSGKPRGVPLNADAVKALDTVEPDPAQRVGLVFRRQDGAEWGQIRTAFATAMTRAGITGFRFHDLRHTFASHFMMRGGTLYDLKEILGHSDLKMTMRYAHLSPHHLRAGVQKLEGLAPMAHETAHEAKNGAEVLTRTP
jgi:integrase